MADDWLIWQLADSAFPSGSFPHSGGLEAAWQQGWVSRDESLASFIDAALLQSARGSLPFAISAFDEPGRIAEWDSLCDVMLTSHVANRASRAQGQSFLAAAERIFRVEELTALQSMAKQNGLATHFAPVFGITARLLGLAPSQVRRLFLFLSLRGLVSSAVRLGIVGPMKGQAIQIEFGKRAQDLAESAESTSAPDASQSAPILELLQSAQDRLYSRLFQS